MKGHCCGRSGLSRLSLRCACVLLVCAAVLLSGCAMSRRGDALEVGRAGNAYLTDRVRDSMDMVTLTVGGGLGVTGRVSAIHAGGYFGADVIGLRGGGLIRIPDLSSKNWGKNWMTVDYILEGVIPYEGCFGGVYVDHIPYWTAMSETPFFALPAPPSDVDGCTSCYRHYLTQVELALGLGPAVRIGINPGEMVDFVLGWTTLDIMADDRGIQGEVWGEETKSECR